LDGLEVGSLHLESPWDGKEEDLCDYLPNAPEDTPLFRCMRSEMKELLARVVSELPEKEQQVLALYYFEELTMKEVGAVLGLGSRACRRFIPGGGAAAGAAGRVDEGGKSRRDGRRRRGNGHS
jgi:DNA-directed RNA polymerase specialized sigma24 family protein